MSSEAHLKYDIHIYDESSDLVWQSSLEETSLFLGMGDSKLYSSVLSNIKTNTASVTLNTSASSK